MDESVPSSCLLANEIYLLRQHKKIEDGNFFCESTFTRYSMSTKFNNHENPHPKRMYFNAIVLIIFEGVC